jgi:hypothetical protein
MWCDIDQSRICEAQFSFYFCSFQAQNASPLGMDVSAAESESVHGIFICAPVLFYRLVSQPRFPEIEK